MYYEFVRVKEGIEVFRRDLGFGRKPDARAAAVNYTASLGRAQASGSLVVLRARWNPIAVAARPVAAFAKRYRRPAFGGDPTATAMVVEV